MPFADTKDFHTYPLIQSATLTASLNDTLRVYEAFGHAALDLQVFYTPKSGQTNRVCTIFVEYSTDNVKWTPLTSFMTDTSDGSMELVENPLTILGASGGTEYARKIELDRILPYVRVSAKETGSANFGAVTIRGTFS